jgi:hypothetical protein
LYGWSRFHVIDGNILQHFAVAECLVGVVSNGFYLKLTCGEKAVGEGGLAVSVVGCNNLLVAGGRLGLPVTY